MTFFYGVALCCLLFSWSINCSPSLRRATSNFTLYAYASDGTFGGIPVFYADGVAYIGLTAPENASVVSNVTFSESGSDSSAWVINSAPAATNITGLDFSIDPASDAFNSVQFTNSNSSSLTTSGFMFYGTLVFWVSSSGDWLSLFYATETGQDNLWTLKWNSNQTSDDGSIPVTLNTQAPGNLASVGKALQAL